MTKKLKVITEQVEDVPLLLAQMKRMKIGENLDKNFPKHGNWQGMSIGKIVEVWLAHILSQGDHRLNHVQQWAKERITVLKRCTKQPVRELDFSDDRLATILHLLSDNSCWKSFEISFMQGLLRVYDLVIDCVRVDTTTASGYWEITEDGLFQLGHSKNKRADLPQVKILLSTLDPMGLPVVSEIVNGNGADDPLYVPAIGKVRNTLKRRGLLYVGDCKMGSHNTRAFVAAGSDFYLCPLSEIQLPKEQMARYLTQFFASGEQLQQVYRNNPNEEQELIAEGFEVEQEMSFNLDGRECKWTERRLIVRSLNLAESAKKSLQTQINKAQVALIALNARGRGKKRCTSIEEMREKAKSILQRYHVETLFSLSFSETIEQKTLRRYRHRPATISEQRICKISFQLNTPAVLSAQDQAGWRVYATNHSKDCLSLQKAVLAYRNEYIIERGFGRLKGSQLSLSPMYLERDDHATGLIRLLFIALSVLSLLEFVARKRLYQARSELAGIYVGNPKRSTSKPTSERMLKAFQNITLSIVHLAGQVLYHLTPLSKLQQRILTLFDFSHSIYDNLAPNS